MLIFVIQSSRSICTSLPKSSLRQQGGHHIIVRAQFLKSGKHQFYSNSVTKANMFFSVFESGSLSVNPNPTRLTEIMFIKGLSNCRAPLALLLMEKPQLD